jgi:hypothetical protein
LVTLVEVYVGQATKEHIVRVICTLEELEEGCNGGCIACGEIQYGYVEPDARQYECESCGEKKVYGLEELLVMGMVDLETE